MQSVTVFKPSLIGPLLSLLVAALIEAFSRTIYPIPNPPAILLITVVFSAFHGGLRAGLLSALIAWLYFVHAFAIPGEPLNYTRADQLRVLIWGIATPLIAAMTGLLKNSAQRALKLERVNAALETRVAAREHAARVLEEKEKRLLSILESLPVGVWLIDDQGNITYGNQAGQAIWAGKRYVGIAQYDEYKAWWADTGKRIAPEEWAAARALRHGESSLEEVIDIECTDGSHKTISNSAAPIFDTEKNIVGVTVVHQDITERRRIEERLAYLASYDTLTGLPNRSLFSDRLAQAMARTHRSTNKLALLLLDLDHFKEINDIFGHGAGDMMLKLVANRLQQGLREVDTIARLGGDEFTMILENISDTDAVARVAHKVRDTFSKPFDLHTRQLSITPSIGIALYPDDAQDAELLLRNADIAMYHAKRTGTGTFQFYTDQMHSLDSHSPGHTE